MLFMAVCVSVLAFALCKVDPAQPAAPANPTLCNSDKGILWEPEFSVWAFKKFGIVLKPN